MKTKLYGVFILLLAVSLLSGCGRQAGNANTARGEEEAFPVISASAQVITLDGAGGAIASDTVDMGKLRSGEIVTKPLVVRNGGEEPLVIIDIDKTCGCVDFTYPRQPLKPGEEAAMELEFDSRGIKGWVYKTAILKTSAAKGEHLIVVTADVE